MSLKLRFYTEILLCVLKKTRTRAHTAEQKDSSSLIFKSNSLLLLSLLPPCIPPCPPPPATLPPPPLPPGCGWTSPHAPFTLQFVLDWIREAIQPWLSSASSVDRFSASFFRFASSAAAVSSSHSKKKKKIQKQIKNILNFQFKRLLAF